MADEKQKFMLPEWLAEHREGTYTDGRRFDEIGFLQCKLILKPDRFTSARVSSMTWAHCTSFAIYVRYCCHLTIRQDSPITDRY